MLHKCQKDASMLQNQISRVRSEPFDLSASQFSFGIPMESSCIICCAHVGTDKRDNPRLPRSFPGRSLSRISPALRRRCASATRICIITRIRCAATVEARCNSGWQVRDRVLETSQVSELLGEEDH